MTQIETPVWTIQKLLNWTVDYFEKHHVASPRLDAELLLAHCCACERVQLYLNYDKPLKDDERTEFRELIKKRVQGVPVAYLLGVRDFWSLNLKVSEHVLIPRPETELLVEKVVEDIKIWQQENPEQICHILELGTGTAAIPLAIASELEGLDITTVDVSHEALHIAQQNVDAYQDMLDAKGHQLRLIESDRFQNVQGVFDFIVSNPPYIPTAVLPTLQVEVKDYEPLLALDGGETGMMFYEYLWKQSEIFLKASGSLWVEIGHDQEFAIRKLTDKTSHLDLEDIYYDLQQHPRVCHLKSTASFS